MSDNYNILDTPEGGGSPTMLDTPENVVDRTTTVTWATINNSTLNDNDATHAILRCYLWGSDNDTTNIHLRMYIRKTGSGLAANELTKTCEIVITDFGSSQSYDVNMNDIVVELDEDHDFDYQIDETSTFDSRDIRIELMGYYA